LEVEVFVCDVEDAWSNVTLELQHLRCGLSASASISLMGHINDLGIIQ
jgi:hypothetical protein